MNYKIYENADLLNKEIEKIVNKANDDPLNSIFSKVIIIIDNEQLNKQIDEIKDLFQNNIVMENQYYVPFLIVITPMNLDLSDFIKKHFNIKLLSMILLI